MNPPAQLQHGLSGGAIAGIVVGVVAGVVLVAGFALYFQRRRTQRPTELNLIMPPEIEGGSVKEMPATRDIEEAPNTEKAELDVDSGQRAELSEQHLHELWSLPYELPSERSRYSNDIAKRDM